MAIWLAVALAVAGALVLARTGLVVVTVVGSSMAPTLDHGDRVLVVRRWLHPVRRGDIVAARIDTIPLPRGAANRPPLVIKRAATVAGDAVFLLGDNGAASDDSRVWGALPLREIVGVMVRRLSRHG